MRKSLFLIAVLLFGIIQAHALDYISIQDYDSDVESICMEMTDTITVSVDPTWESGLDLHSWILAGDVSFANGYGANSNPCKIVVPSDGYGKGRVSYKYKDGTCSSVEYFDVFKSFACPQGLEIKGPECIVDSQEVVYSVDPMLTKNLGAQIGIDSYTWNVLKNNQPFVHEILHVSSDSSSVTFKVGRVNPQNPPIITVTVGQCNEWQLSKTLGNATPKPDLQDIMYLPVGFGDVKVGVIDPKPNMEYTWACPSFAIESYGNNGDSAVIHITGQDADKMEFEVYVNATYTDITCNTSADTMKVMRTWGHTGIFDKNNITDSCYTPNNTYTFAVEGELPINTKCDWRLPQGWNFHDGNVSNLKTITIYPSSSSKLVDTLFVKPLDAHDHASPDTLIVHVKPIPVPVSRIMQNSCLQYNEESVVYVDTTGLNMPEEVWFEWSAPYAEILNTQGTDTLRFIPSTQTNIVSVTAKGINSCDAASTEHNLIFEPQKPDSIIWEDSACVSFNMPDTLKFTVANALPGQKYEWTKPTGWRWGDTISDPKDLAVTIELISNGKAKIDTIYAKGVNENNSDCSFSDSVVFYITTDSLPAHIQYYGKQGSRTRYGIEYGWDIWEEGDPDPLYYPEEVCWYLFNNGIPYNEAILNGRYSETVEFARTFGDIINSTQYTLVVDVKFDNGCKTRVQYGATLNLDTMDMQRSAPLMRRTVETTIIPKLIVKPNPTPNAAIINLTNSHLEIADLYVYNIGGQLIKSINNFHINSELDVSMLPVGKYIVVLKDGEDEYVQHFLKSR